MLHMQRSKPTAISLFAGGGGLDIGIEQAGFQTLACIELDTHASQTLSANQPRYFPGARIINADVLDVDVARLAVELDLQPGELDLLFGGPPCQSFSQIGKMAGLDDARGRLLFAPLAYARQLKPKIVLIENVKALSTAKDAQGVRGGILEELCAELEEAGYAVQSSVLNAADYGVPQARKRTFIVAVSKHLPGCFRFPAPSHGAVDAPRHVTVGDVLRGLKQPLSRDFRDHPSNHVDVTPERDRERISYVEEGAYLAKSQSAPPSVKGRLSPKDTTKFLRLSRERQSNTLRCGEIFFHPTENRYLTPREYMRLQGFPDDYFLTGPIRGRTGTVKNLDQHRQIANSVPPPLAFAVASELMKTLTSTRAPWTPEPLALATVKSMTP